MGRVGELVEERGVCDVVRRLEGGQVAREGGWVTREVDDTPRMPRRREDLRDTGEIWGRYRGDLLPAISIALGQA